MGKVSGSQIAIPTLLKVESGALGSIGNYLRDNKLNNVVTFRKNKQQAFVKQ